METILRDFCFENKDSLKEIKEDIRVANNRINDTKRWIVEVEEWLQYIEDAALEILELQKQLETRQVDQEGCSRRENVRIHGVKEGAEDNARTMSEFIKTLLREKLELPP